MKFGALACKELQEESACPFQCLPRDGGGVPVFNLRLGSGCIAHITLGMSRVQQNLLFPAFGSILNGSLLKKGGAFFICSAYGNLQCEFNYSSLDTHHYFPPQPVAPSELVFFVYFLVLTEVAQG